MPINYNFTPSSDVALFDTAMPDLVFRIHSYILKRLQLSGWKINRTDICRQFKISLSTVKRAFKWLRDHGYAVWDSNAWTFYPAPNVSNITAIGGSYLTPLPPVIFDPPYIKESLQRKEQQPQAPVELVEHVVVSIESESLVYPEQLTPKQKTAVKSIAKQLKEPEMTQELLFTLSYAIANGHIKSSLPGYFRRLVDAANEGRYTATKAATATAATPGGSPIVPIWKGRPEVKVSKPEVASGFFAAMKSAVGSAKR